MSHVNIAAICLCCLFAPAVVPGRQDGNGQLSDKCATYWNTPLVDDRAIEPKNFVHV